jgi:hypothetical protein
MVGASNVEMGWFDKLKNSLQFDKLAEKLNISSYKLLDMALFLGIGFFVGFLWKRYANYVIAAICFIGLVILLNQLEIITVTINWVKIQDCCGIRPVSADPDVVGTLWEWSKQNLLIIFSFIIGFCFGAKVS